MTIAETEKLLQILDSEVVKTLLKYRELVETAKKDKKLQEIFKKQTK